MSGKNVAILGMSENPDRYSYKAFFLLKDKGHHVYPISPKLTEFEGEKVYPSLSDLKGEGIDTLTVYVRAEISSGLSEEIKALRPKRVIFNPGSENANLSALLDQEGIAHEEACTLVLLNTNQF